MEATGTRLLWGTANLFTNRRFMAGAATNLTGLEVPVRIQGASVTPTFFGLLGASSFRLR